MSHAEAATNDRVTDRGADSTTADGDRRDNRRDLCLSYSLAGKPRDVVSLHSRGKAIRKTVWRIIRVIVLLRLGHRGNVWVDLRGVDGF